MTPIATTPSAQKLIDMLRTKRPYKSAGEQGFVDRFLAPLCVEPDTFGNLWLQIGIDPTILWSSHTDTCHRTDGTQRIAYANGIIRLAPDEPANCLGADCAAGVWLMTEMIAARIPGLYIFHRGEERGGLGSNYIADHTPDRLADITAAIAFDRRGTNSIITHQQGGRCASESFAESLSACLGLDHQADPTGSFTDTANYTHLVGECSNVSVGYDHEHTPLESLDTRYLFALRDAVLKANFSSLECVREPNELYGDFAWEGEGFDRNAAKLYEIVYRQPAAVAAFLSDIGITEADMRDYL